MGIFNFMSRHSGTISTKIIHQAEAETEGVVVTGIEYLEEAEVTDVSYYIEADSSESAESKYCDVDNQVEDHNFLKWLLGC